MALTQPSASRSLEAEYPGATMILSPNRGLWVQGVPRKITNIVIHITAGASGIGGTINWLCRPGGKASAHFVVGQEGQVVQLVPLADISWHTSPAVNPMSIGIEHVARPPKGLGPNDPGLMPTEAEYAASAKLVRWLCERYKLPIDRKCIIGHNEADKKTTHTGCPTGAWDWDRYMWLLLPTTAVRVS